MPNLTAFLSYVILTAYTPGPNNIMAMSNASKHGFWGSLRFCFGVFLGSCIVMISCALFTSLVYSYIPALEPYLVYLGAAYILWLAWVIWRDAPHAEKKSAVNTNSVGTAMVLQFVNVKGILYGITSFSSFILPYYKNTFVILGFVLLLSANVFASNVCWALFGSLFQKLFNTHAKLVNTVMALLLVYCAVSTVLH